MGCDDVASPHVGRTGPLLRYISTSSSGLYHPRPSDSSSTAIIRYTMSETSTSPENRPARLGKSASSLLPLLPPICADTRYDGSLASTRQHRAGLSCRFLSVFHDKSSVSWLPISSRRKVALESIITDAWGVDCNPWKGPCEGSRLGQSAAQPDHQKYKPRKY